MIPATMNRFRLALPLCLLGALVLGCGGEPAEPEPPAGEMVKSDKQRVSSPRVSAADLGKQIEANTAFAARLYQQVRSQPGNLFFSPHSISTALAMLYAGAAGQTESQMAAALGYVLPQADLHPAFNHLDLELSSRGQGKKAADGGKFRLKVVNATWGQKGYSFLPGYLDVLAVSYGAGLRLLDFQSAPEPARQTINNWVAYQTEQRIQDLLPKGSVDAATRLVLTNAIYFNAAWQKAFDPKETKSRPFTLADGSQVQAMMMRGELEKTHYLKGTGFVAAALPYDGEELSLVLLVPDKGTLATFEAGLDGAKIRSIVGQLAPTELDITLPRFEFTAKLSLVDHLRALGMKDAFSAGAADFSGIDGSRGLYVTGVFHKAFVKVNESGTEAAAATGVVVGRTSIPSTPTLVVDRPFLFLIRDNKTGAVLFLGRVAKP